MNSNRNLAALAEDAGAGPEILSGKAGAERANPAAKEAPRERSASPKPFPAYKKVSRAEIGRTEWDKFAADSPTAWFYHRYDYSEIWGCWAGKRDLSFGLIDPTTSRLVATVPAYKISDRMAKWIQWNLVDVYGGVACCPLLPKKARTAVLNAVGEELRGMAREHQAHEIRFSMAPMTPMIRGDDCPRINPLLELGCDNGMGYSWVCDLRKSQEELWKNVGKGARSSISKAQKMGVEVRPAVAADVEAYYRIHCETYRRTGEEPQPREYFEGIWKYFLNEGLAAIFVAELKGEVVAAANFAIYKKGAYYWTGASNAAGLSAGANALLQWHAMKWISEQGVEWYEVGDAYPFSKNGKLKQLSDFKKDFGGALFPSFRGAIDTKNRMGKALALLKEFRNQVLG